MTSRARIALISVFAAGALCGLAPPAQANHHFMLIREYFPGTTTNVDQKDAFIELQMWAAGQNITGGHHIDLYGPGNDNTPATHTLAMTNAASGENQRTILIGGIDVTGRDYAEEIGPNGDPSGGAICFRSDPVLGGFGVIDCVEWGTGNSTINAGTPVSPGGITDGKSITRSITPGCASLLEPGDDTNDSATDFAETDPTPRANSVTPTEGPCRTVTFNIVGSGTVKDGTQPTPGLEIDCPGDCSHTYPNHATNLEWTATPSPGETFLGWTNCPSGDMSSECSVNDLTSNLSITANFSGAAQPPPGGGNQPPPAQAPAKKKCKKGQKLKKGKCVKKKRKKK